MSDQIDVTGNTAFAITFNTEKKMFTNRAGTIAIYDKNPGSVATTGTGIDATTPAPINPNRYGCLNQNDEILLCPPHVNPDFVLCSSLTNENHATKKLNHKLSTLVLTGDDEVVKLIKKLRNFLVRKNGNLTLPLDNTDTWASELKSKSADCIPMQVVISPPPPEIFSDILVSPEEYSGLELHLQQIQDFILQLKNTIELMDKDTSQVPLELFIPTRSATEWGRKLFKIRTLKFTVPAACLTLLTFFVSCCGISCCYSRRLRQYSIDQGAHVLLQAAHAAQAPENMQLMGPARSPPAYPQ